VSDDQEFKILDPPNPDLIDLQQRDITPPAVPVKVEGLVRVQTLPAKAGPSFVHFLTTRQEQVLGRDLTRSRALLLGSVAWQYCDTKSGARLVWPANVPMEITHADEVWASVASVEGELYVITELYGD